MGTQPSFSEHLAQVSHDIAGQPLPGDVAEKARLCLLDFVSALLYGTRSPMNEVGGRMLPALGDGSATLVGRRTTGSLHAAAFFHGLIATAEDLDDSHRFATGMHLSAVTIPAALAVAEDRGCSGRQLLGAIVAGYEVAGRLSRAGDSGLRARGWHSTGAVGPFGAAAASGMLLGLDAAALVSAFGIAASGAGGLFAFLSEGATVRHAHGAWASANGMLAAMLAASGMTGPGRVLEGEDGYFAAFAERHDPAFILAPSPIETGIYEISSAYHKIYACCGHAFPSITAALALRQSGLAAQDVASIEARVYKASAALTNASPRSVDEAKFSLPFILAIALVHGDVSRKAMCEDNIADPRVRALAAKVTVTEDAGIAAAFPRLRAAELRVATSDGRRFRQYVDAPLGMPENPVHWSELVSKFEDAAGDLLDQAGAAQLLDFIRHVDELDDINKLTRLLRHLELQNAGSL